MVTRRNFIKGGGAAVTGLAAASLASCSTDPTVKDDSISVTPVVGTTVDRFRRGGVGPLYWSTYGYNFQTNEAMPEEIWAANVNWVAKNFLPYGYRMVCTDGWVDYTQRVTSHGYVRSYQDNWSLDWAGIAKSVAGKGLELGVYYNPLWVTKSSVENPSITVIGRPDVPVANIVNSHDYLNSDGELYWVDVTKDGAEEYVKGYVKYFRDLGAVFLRIDFLGWFEIGYDQSGGTVGVAHGREAYLTALSWMREAAGDMILSLVMPNCFNHAEAERQFGDLIRIDNDASYGGWYFLSEGPQTWQPIWCQWNNPFLGFTGFSDVSGRGQLILDGDPQYMSKYGNDDERQTAINLFVMAGAAIAIADQYDTISSHASFFQNTEVLALRARGLVGKPVYLNTHGFFYDDKSRDVERWIAQLPDGSWIIGLFNRDDGPGTTSKSIDFADELGLGGSAKVYDLWAHQDLGVMSSFSAALRPHASVLISVTPSDRPNFEAEVGAWSGTARFENSYSGHEGLGYLTGLDTPGSSLTIAMAAPKSGSYKIDCHVANATGSVATLDVASLDPLTGQQIGSTTLKVPSTANWTKWQTVQISLNLQDGDNLVVLAFGEANSGSVNVDYIALRA